MENGEESKKSSGTRDAEMVILAGAGAAMTTTAAIGGDNADSGCGACSGCGT